MRSSACTTSRLLRPGHRRRSGRRWSGTHLDALLDKPVPEGPPHPRSVLVRLHRPDEMPSPPEYAAPDSVLVDEDDPTSRAHVLVTDDYFRASRGLVLDEVLEQAGIASPPGGLLLAIPFRHLVVLPVSGSGVLLGLQWLAQFAAGEFETQPGPSPMRWRATRTNGWPAGVAG